MRETRRADQMLPGVGVRFTADGAIYAGTIASTRRVSLMIVSSSWPAGVPVRPSLTYA